MQSRKSSGIFLLGIRELFQNSIPRWEGDKVRETCRQHHDLALAIVTYSSTTTLYVAGSARGILGDISADADVGNDHYRYSASPSVDVPPEPQGSHVLG
jgi:hypothetical protein